MGQIIRLITNSNPAVTYVYDIRNYDPLKGQQRKLNRPGAAAKLSLSSENKLLSTISPRWQSFFTSPTYRAAYSDYRRQVHLGNDLIQLDPVIYRDWRPGMQLNWQGGVYVNESPFRGPRTLYEYSQLNNKDGCPCK